MAAIIRYRLPIRLCNVYCLNRQCVAFESSNSSSRKGGPTPSEKMIDERYRTKEPRITKGEVFSRATLSPQVYDTSLEDNFQRTTVSLYSKDMKEEKRHYIINYSEIGFTLVNDTILLGPIALFPKTVLSWRVRNVDEITTESLLLFTIIEPKLDIVVVGAGDQKNIRPIKERIAPLFRKHNIMLEVLDTHHACATFNFLNNEGRYVAAALFPAIEIKKDKTKDLHVTERNWDTSLYNSFGFDRSTGVMDMAANKLEKFAKERRERGELTEEEEEKERERAKEKSKDSGDVHW